MPASLQLLEYSDAELLHIVNDLADADGWVEASAVAARIGIQHENPTRCVISRFSWLCRFGVMHRDPDELRYRLTPEGQAVISAKLRASQMKMLDTLADEALMAVTGMVTTRWRGTNRANAHLVRRAWQHGTGRKS